LLLPPCDWLGRNTKDKEEERERNEKRPKTKPLAEFAFQSCFHTEGDIL
jgi:hypothetical protein